MKVHEGCLAVIINKLHPKNIGQIVTVGKYIGIHPMVEDSSNGNLWEVDRKIVWFHGGKFPVYRNMVREEALLIIGDHRTLENKGKKKENQKHITDLRLLDTSR